jgi:hypothetical protein
MIHISASSFVTALSMSHHMEWVISGYYSNYGLDNNKKLQCCCWMGGGATLRIINNMNISGGEPPKNATMNW